MGSSPRRPHTRAGTGYLWILDRDRLGSCTPLVLQQQRITSIDRSQPSDGQRRPSAGAHQGTRILLPGHSQRRGGSAVEHGKSSCSTYRRTIISGVSPKGSGPGRELQGVLCRLRGQRHLRVRTGLAPVPRTISASCRPGTGVEHPARGIAAQFRSAPRRRCWSPPGTSSSPAGRRSGRISASNANSATSCGASRCRPARSASTSFEVETASSTSPLPRGYRTLMPAAFKNGLDAIDKTTTVVPGGTILVFKLQ